MRVVHRALAADRAAARTDLTPEVVVGTFRSLAEPADRLEHLHAQRRSGHLKLTVFVLADSQAAAEIQVRALCHRVLATAPVLSGWRLVD